MHANPVISFSNLSHCPQYSPTEQRGGVGYTHLLYVQSSHSEQSCGGLRVGLIDFRGQGTGPPPRNLPLQQFCHFGSIAHSVPANRSEIAYGGSRNIQRVELCGMGGGQMFQRNWRRKSVKQPLFDLESLIFNQTLPRYEVARLWTWRILF